MVVIQCASQQAATKSIIKRVWPTPLAATTESELSKPTIAIDTSALGGGVLGAVVAEGVGDAEVDALYDYVGAKKDAAGNWLYDQFTPDQLHAIIGFGAVFLAPAFAPEKAVGAAATEMGELANNIKVIGRLTDTEVAKDWVGHEVLDIPEWSIEKNMQWVDSGIENGQTFYLASPIEGNTIQTGGSFAGQPTVMAREIKRLEKAGYVRIGDYYVSPAQIGIFQLP
ncbi:MAG: hypothetical protein IPP74_05280 [Alphaproteobacteria bacterium]|nr:hypothetical protein [Alphaproteobacteria bacterium]